MFSDPMVAGLVYLAQHDLPVAAATQKPPTRGILTGLAALIRGGAAFLRRPAHLTGPLENPR